MRRSKVLAKLRAGKVALGANISMGPSITVSALAGKLGMDFTWIDMEHRWFTFHDAALMILACRETDVDAMVRVPDRSAPAFHRCFELGAAGVMMPHCRSQADAKLAVDASKFAPVGRRSSENVMVDGDYGLTDMKEFVDWQTRESFVVVQIEDVEAVDALDEIVSTPGVDVFFVGPGDLSLSYGKPGQTNCPEIQTAMKKVARACEKYKKHWGLPTGPDPQRIKQLVDLGARFIVPCVDYIAILLSWQRTMDDVKNLFAKANLL